MHLQALSCCLLSGSGASVFQQEPRASGLLAVDLRLDLCRWTAGGKGRAWWPGAEAEPG